MSASVKWGFVLFDWLKEDVAIRQYENTSEPVRYFYVHSRDEQKFSRLWTLAIQRLSSVQRRMITDTVLSRWSKRIVAVH